MGGLFTHRRWEIESVWGEEKRILQAMRELSETGTVAMSPERIDDMASAVAEACLNAIEHGNSEDPARLVTVEMMVDTSIVRIRVFDEGAGFKGTLVIPNGNRDISDNPRGWGMLLINGLADQWNTGQNAEGFYIELLFMQQREVGPGGGGTV